MIPIVLLIEDNPNNVSLIEDIFEYDEIPAKIVIVGSGEEAILRASQLLPALILMDLRLPGIDGLETTQILKDNPLTKDIPVWAITAYAMPGDEERAKAAGCCQYITKPTNMRDFTDRLREFVNVFYRERADICASH
jgi:two-component system cell cycle response regulator DivK